jgi:hypothetical protein
MISGVSRKFVFLAGAVPDECARYAQVAIVTKHTWSLIGPAPYRAHGRRDFAKMPRVGCPVIDLTDLPAGKEADAAAILRMNMSQTFGAIQLAQMAAQLEVLGAKVYATFDEWKHHHKGE